MRPTNITVAKAFIARHHRHCDPPRSGLWAAGVESNGQLVGVAIVGRPNARPLDDGWNCEITRCTTDGHRNACSKLYGACLSAAKSLGFARAYTYTSVEEPGSSLRAVGFVIDAELPARASWSCPSRPRTQTDLFGHETRPPGPKFRWVKVLNEA